MRRFLAALLAIFICMISALPVSATAIDDDESTEEASTTIQTTEYPDDPTRAPDLASEAAIVMDAKTGAILYEKNAYIPEYPASITKLMTCLLALENVALNDTVTLSYDAVFGIERDSSHVGLNEGEQISAESCLYAIMVESANEASWAMGEHISGTIADFATLMNERALQLGCRNSNFVNANGLHDAAHYSCAYDIALILKQCLEFPMFRTLSSTINYEIPPTNLTEEVRPLWNTLKMIRPTSKYYYQYIEGGKTGYTTDANCTLATFAKKGNMELICVVMNCNSRTNTYSDSRALYEYCFNNFSYTYPLKDFSFSAPQTEDNVILSNFYNSVSDDLLNLTIDQNYCLVLNNNISMDALSTSIVYSEQQMPGVLGHLQFSHDGKILGSTPISYKYYGDATISPDTATPVPSTEASVDNTETTEAIDDTTNPVASTEETDNDTTDKPKKKGGIGAVFKTIGIVIVVLFVLFTIYLNIQRYRLNLRRRRRARRKQQRRQSRGPKYPRL